MCFISIYGQILLNLSKNDGHLVYIKFLQSCMIFEQVFKKTVLSNYPYFKEKNSKSTDFLYSFYSRWPRIYVSVYLVSCLFCSQVWLNCLQDAQVAFSALQNWGEEKKTTEKLISVRYPEICCTLIHNFLRYADSISKSSN